MTHHEFDGACVPDSNLVPRFRGQTTFSVGIYPVIPRANGKGTKRGKVVVRVYGLCERPDPVYTMARAIVRALDAGTYDGPKTVRVA